jgi:hypothetical protein
VPAVRKHSQRKSKKMTDLRHPTGKPLLTKFLLQIAQKAGGGTAKVLNRET